MGIKKSAGLWLALFFLLTLTGCNRLKSVDERTDLALSRAEQAGFETHQFDFQGFSIRSFSRLTKPDLPLHVHVEGDGRAYIAPWRISANPTPIHPVSLDLALSDDSANVIYLARPCQFLTIQCDPKLWTSHRYSERVVDAMESALFELAKGQKNTEKTLIGFSGGGVIAALLAARSATPSRLITIAANLNHEHWTEHFGHSPLNGSLNPVDFASELRRVPQVHLLGAEDERVPLDTISSYTKALGDTGRWEVRVVPGFDHRCCWWEAWPTLIRDLTAKLNSS